MFNKLYGSPPHLLQSTCLLPLKLVYAGTLDPFSLAQIKSNEGFTNPPTVGLVHL